MSIRGRIASISASSIACLPLLALALTGCSTAPPPEEPARTVAAGEKASVGHLTYTIVDEQIQPQLGDEASPRIPHDRFIVLQIAVTNSSNVDNPIPTIQLISDTNQTYNELPDGTGVANWLGVSRQVSPGQTERGMIVFDAPPAHYKVKFTDEHMDKEILADMPLSYAHEKANESFVPNSELPDPNGPTGPQKK